MTRSFPVDPIVAVHPDGTRAAVATTSAVAVIELPG